MTMVRKGSVLLMQSMQGGSVKSKASNESLKDMEGRKAPSDNGTRNGRGGEEVESFVEQPDSEKIESSATQDHDNDHDKNNDKNNKETHNKPHHETDGDYVLEPFESIKNDHDHDSFTRTKKGDTIAEYKSGN